MSLYDVPPLVDSCHCTVGARQPVDELALAVNVAAAGAVTVALAGCVVIDGAVQTGGAGLTVSVAALVVVLPALLVNTARYWLPDCETLVGEIVSVVDVSPAMSLNDEAPLVETCHLTLGAGHPAGVEPAAVNEAEAGAVTVALAGCVVIAGAVHTGGAGFTVSVAALVVVLPALLVNTARYWLPDCPTLVGETVSVVEVAPEMSLNDVPPLVETCHLTLGAEHPAGVEPAAVNEAEAGAVTVALAGCVVMDGATHVGGAGVTVSVAALVGVLPAVLVNTAR